MHCSRSAPSVSGYFIYISAGKGQPAFVGAHTKVTQALEALAVATAVRYEREFARQGEPNAAPPMYNIDQATGQATAVHYVTVTERCFDMTCLQMTQ